MEPRTAVEPRTACYHFPGSILSSVLPNKNSPAHGNGLSYDSASAVASTLPIQALRRKVELTDQAPCLLMGVGVGN